MDSRTRALNELKRRIEEQKARLDPKLLKMAQQALRGQHSDSVPYDRDAALKAIELFLLHHDDPKGFERRLRDLIGKNRH